ncbi:MAG: hypothetical protein JWO33_2487 [Caulobacteraceae bacterium]|nr:hypothetical protein [Caulobacteraceae bacterium]
MSDRLKTSLFVAVVGLSLGACAPASQDMAATRQGRTCILSRQVDSWAAQGIDVVNVKVNQDYFRLNLAEACPEIQEADRIRLNGRGTSFICVGEAAAAEVTAYSKVTGPKRCLVRDMQRLTSAEVASLSKSEKP